MKWFLVLGLLLMSACTGTREQRLADIHKAEDDFCAFRAKEKALEALPDATQTEATPEAQAK